MSRDVFGSTVDPEAMSGSNPHTVKNLRESNIQQSIAVFGENIVWGGYRLTLLRVVASSASNRAGHVQRVLSGENLRYTCCNINSHFLVTLRYDIGHQ